MRVWTLIELLHLTRAELFGIQREIVNALAATPLASPDRPSLSPTCKHPQGFGAATGRGGDTPIADSPQIKKYGGNMVSMDSMVSTACETGAFLVGDTVDETDPTRRLAEQRLPWNASMTRRSTASGKILRRAISS